MKLFRSPIFLRCLWMLMALHILNFSVDPPDAAPDYLPEDTSINEMESVVEIVLEEGLDIDNAIPESDEADNPDGDKQTIKNLKLYYESVAEVQIATETAEPNYKSVPTGNHYRNGIYQSPHLGLVCPPPEV